MKVPTRHWSKAYDPRNTKKPPSQSTSEPALVDHTTTPFSDTVPVGPTLVVHNIDLTALYLIIDKRNKSSHDDTFHARRLSALGHTADMHLIVNLSEAFECSLFSQTALVVLVPIGS